MFDNFLEFLIKEAIKEQPVNLRDIEIEEVKSSLYSMIEVEIKNNQSWWEDKILEML